MRERIGNAHNLLIRFRRMFYGGRLWGLPPFFI
jgi:hypothetical protein